MARRTTVAGPEPEVADADQLRSRFRQLELRMCLSQPLESPEYNQLKRAIDALDRGDAAEALSGLIELADELRATLPLGVLPEELIERWRAELAGCRGGSEA